MECGDGVVNAAAGEACDDGEESETCNANCQPAACGDGIVNVAAGEGCEDGALCDLTTCTYQYSVGGGCGESLFRGRVILRRRRRLAGQQQQREECGDVHWDRECGTHGCQND